MNSRTKGANGERELAQLLRKQGWADARRGQQYSGIGIADVVGVTGIHIECKRCEHIRDEEWMQQSERDAKRGEVPVVIYRRNHEAWKVILRQDIANMIWQVLTDEQKDFIRNTIKLK